MARKKIKGNASLEKDEKSGAIISTNRQALLLAKASKIKRIDDMGRINTLEENVDKLTKLVNKLIKEAKK